MRVWVSHISWSNCADTWIMNRRYTIIVIIFSSQISLHIFNSLLMNLQIRSHCFVMILSFWNFNKISLYIIHFNFGLIQAIHCTSCNMSNINRISENLMWTSLLYIITLKLLGVNHLRLRFLKAILLANVGKTVSYPSVTWKVSDSSNDWLIEITILHRT